MSDILNKTEEIVKKAKGSGADEVVAKTTFGKYRQVRFSNNQVDISVAWNDYVTDIALAWKKRVVATQIRNFQDVDANIEKLLKLAKVSKENPMFGGFAKGSFKYGKSNADKKLENLEDPVGFLEFMGDRRIRTIIPDNHAVTKVDLNVLNLHALGPDPEVDRFIYTNSG